MANPLRETKMKILPPAGAMIALGSKSRQSGNNGSSSYKRDSSTPPAGEYKRIRLMESRLSRNSPQHEFPDAAPFEVSAEDLVDLVLTAVHSDHIDRLDKLLCSAMQSLKSMRTKSDTVSLLVLSLMYLAKRVPEVFLSPAVTDCLCGFLRRSETSGMKQRNQTSVILACNVLMHVFRSESSWPLTFLSLLMEDAIGERCWVDNEYCKEFVLNILTAFNTTLPQSIPDYCNLGIKDPEIPVPDDPVLSIRSGMISGVSSSTFLDADESLCCRSSPRYQWNRSEVVKYTLDVIKEQMNKRVVGIGPGSSNTDGQTARNLLKLLAACSGLPDVRTIASHKLELWLQNPKLTKHAQELFIAVCGNCNSQLPGDSEVILSIIKMRLKAKPLLEVYKFGIALLLKQHCDNIGTLITHVVYNELNPQRNPSNMTLLSIAFSFDYGRALKHLTHIFHQLLVKKEDYLRTLRTLLREIVKNTQTEFQFVLFSMSLMSGLGDIISQTPDFTNHLRLFQQVIDLLVLSVFLGGLSACGRGPQDNKADDSFASHDFRYKAAQVQNDIVTWFKTEVIKIFDNKISSEDFLQGLHKVLFLDSFESYSCKDGWPTESDRGNLMRLVTELPLFQDTIMQILIMGIDNSVPITNHQSLDFVDLLCSRAVSLYNKGYMNALKIDKLDIIDVALKLCLYRHPDSIQLPSGYVPPVLAISVIYWKTWEVLLMFAALNPQTIGKTAWQSHPQLKLFMEMAMTKSYSFPPETSRQNKENVDIILNKEMRSVEEEKQKILEFETYLAAASTKQQITEQNSLLLPQLLSFNITGDARCPTAGVIESVKERNTQFKLGSLLCQSREPDFLMDIIQHQGTCQSQPWLTDLVLSSECSLSVLPVPCLCAFLLAEVATLSNSDSSEKRVKLSQLLSHLRSEIHNSSASRAVPIEIVLYFMTRLSQKSPYTRLQALQCLKFLLNPPESTPSATFSVLESLIDMDAIEPALPDYVWLIKYFPQLNLFPAVLVSCFENLRSACHIETNIPAISAYIIIFGSQCRLLDLPELAVTVHCISDVIIHRPTIFSGLIQYNEATLHGATLAAILRVFGTYMDKIMSIDDESHSLSNSQANIILKWNNGKSTEFHMFVVHASVLLLIHAEPNNHRDTETYTKLVDLWFPDNGQQPKAISTETLEVIPLVPDWLKLRMIRSTKPLIVQYAIKDLDPAQLVLFVQSFGIPLLNIDIILEVLDDVANNTPNVLTDHVSDKRYMSHLVKVNQRRGAKRGCVFQKWLQVSHNVDETKDVEMESPAKIIKPPPHLNTIDADCLSNYDIMEYLQYLFGLYPGHLKSQNVFQFHQCILQHLFSNRVILERFVNSLSDVMDIAADQCVVDGIGERSHMLFAITHLLLNNIPSDMRSMDNIQKSIRTNVCKILKIRSFSVLSPIITGCPIGDPLMQSTAPCLPSTARCILLANDGVTKYSIIQLVEAFATIPNTVDTGTALDAVIKFLIRRHSELSAVFVSEYIRYLVSPSLPSITSTQLGRVGLLLDWYQVLKPEIVNSLDDCFMVFGPPLRKPTNATPMELEEVSFREFLLTSLIHQSTWETLTNCINWILQSKNNSTLLSTKFSLRFITGCLRAPKIWQGRDMKAPQRVFQTDILSLNQMQLENVTRIIITDCCRSLKADRSPMLLTEVIRGRVSLVFLLAKSMTSLQHVAKHLIAESKSTDSDTRKVSSLLLLHVYLFCPDVLDTYKDDFDLCNSYHGIEFTTGQIDRTTHQLIMALGTTESSKECEDRMYDANIYLRKLASYRPVIFLRQLPLLGVIMNGRTSTSFGEFKRRKNFLLFTHVVGIIELLIPHIYHTAYRERLLDIIQSYFNFLQVYTQHNKSIGAIITKLCVFLRGLLHYDSNALSFLSAHKGLLRDVANVYSENVSLSELLNLEAEFTLRGKVTEGSNTAGPPVESIPGGMRSSFIGLSSIQSRPHSPPLNLAPFLAKVGPSAPLDDVMMVLNDLDETSKRKVDLLVSFIPALQQHMTSSSQDCRVKVHDLILRLIRHYPKLASEFLEGYLQCLLSNDPAIVQSAIHNLPEFCQLCRENSKFILNAAFSVGLNAKMETGSAVKDCLQFLNLETITQ